MSKKTVKPQVKILKIPIKKAELLPTTTEELEPAKAGPMPEMKTLKDKVKDVSFGYSNYGGADDAGVTDKHGRYFTLTLKDGSTKRLAPQTYKNYFGEYSLLNPDKKLKVFKVAKIEQNIYLFERGR